MNAKAMQQKKIKDSLTELTLIQASLKRNEGSVYENLSDKKS